MPDRDRNLRFASRRPNPASVFALITLALIVIRAARTVDPFWDTLAYHWPFAARLANLCDVDCFSLTSAGEQRYQGFPLLLHAAQGWLWRLTGTPGLADLINIAGLLALCAYLRLRFAVPLAWSWLAFLAIPIVQIQLTSSYIDVPANAAVTLALLVTLRMLVEPTSDHRVDVVIAIGALGVAAGSKFQMVPIALLTWLVLIVLASRQPGGLGFKKRWQAAIAVGAAGALALLPKLLFNLLTFGNPFHPIAVNIGPIHWPGIESTLAGNSVSDFWRASPGPVRWLASVLEVNSFNGRPLPWTLDQGDVQQSSPSFRMGGYFVPYVLAALALLWWSARSATSARLPLAALAVLSVICAWSPASHELRYYLFWMLFLISTVLAVAHSPAFANARQSAHRAITHAAIAIALASVIAMTGGEYLKTHGTTLTELVRDTDGAVARVPEGGTLCILNRSRSAFLFASLFHPGRHYRTRVLWAEEPADCAFRFDPERDATAVPPSS